MTEYDTIKVYVDGSICESTRYENLIITKQNDSAFIQTDIEYQRTTKYFKALPKTHYEFFQSDSLNFENFFSYLNKRNDNGYKRNSLLLRLISPNDTISFYSDGLIDRLKCLSYYQMIMGRIYPTEKLYMIPEPPPPEINTE